MQLIKLYAQNSEEYIDPRSIAFFDCCLAGFTIFNIKMLPQNLCFLTMSVITIFFFSQHLNLPVIIGSHNCCISAFPIWVFFHSETFLLPCYLDCSINGNCPVQHRLTLTLPHCSHKFRNHLHIFFASNILPLL